MLGEWTSSFQSSLVLKKAAIGTLEQESQVQGPRTTTAQCRKDLFRESRGQADEELHGLKVVRMNKEARSKLPGPCEQSSWWSYTVWCNTFTGCIPWTSCLDSLKATCLTRVHIQSLLKVVLRIKRRNTFLSPHRVNAEEINRVIVAFAK